MRHGVCVLVVSALACSAAAQADDFTGFYAGLGIGAASVDGLGVDDSAAGGRVFIGYSFGSPVSQDELLSLELSYVEAGTTRRRGSFLGPGLVPAQLSFTREVDAKALDFSLLGTLPINDRFALFGKLGYATVDLDVTSIQQPFIGTTLLRTTASHRDERVSYGGGLAFNVGRALQARAAYERFDLDAANFDLISLSAIYKFR